MFRLNDLMNVLDNVRYIEDEKIKLRKMKICKYQMKRDKELSRIKHCLKSKSLMMIEDMSENKENRRYLEKN